jgi:RNA polymerase sigma factor (sigma-70 family)
MANATLPPFQVLIDRHAEEVLGLLRGAVGRVDADDCFQETFIAALRAYPRLGHADNLRGWLLTIAHRKALDHHRSKGRRPVPVAETEAIAEPASEGPLPDSDGIWTAVAELPPKQKAAVTMRFALDLRHAEIASALGCSPEAARRSLHEGLKRLRKEMR